MFRSLTLSLTLLCWLDAAFAQGAQVAFGLAPQDPNEPVEVTSENLSVDQEAGTAIFTGDVVVVQGEMTLTAPKVVVFNKENGDGIDRVEATGGVTLVSGPDEAESQRADYTIDDGLIVMTGDVLLNQQGSTLSSERMDVQLHDGTAQMTGRVRSILKTGNN